MKVQVTIDYSNDVLDIPSMASLSEEQYRTHLKQEGLFWVDHHHVLRAKHLDFPMATNKIQLDILIEVLNEQRVKLADAL